MTDVCETRHGQMRQRVFIDPAKQIHQYELLGPDHTEPVARVAACGYRPISDPNDMKSLGGWRDVEQNYRDCAECWDEARRRWGA